MAHWKTIDGYEELYLINDRGMVISLPREIKTRNRSGNITIRRKAKVINPHLRGRGGLLYPAITLSKNGKAKAYSLHRLVAQAFVSNPDNLPEVNHIDKNPLNCCANNLEWCDHQYNVEYSKNKKVIQYLDGEKIAEYKSTTYASKLTGISRTAICNVLNGWSLTAGGYAWKYGDEIEGRDDLSH